MSDKAEFESYCKAIKSQLDIARKNVRLYQESIKRQQQQLEYWERQSQALDTVSIRNSLSDGFAELVDL